MTLDHDKLAPLGLNTFTAITMASGANVVASIDASGRTVMHVPELVVGDAIIMRAPPRPALKLDDETDETTFSLNTTAPSRFVPAHFLSYTHDAFFLVADLGIQPVWSSRRLQSMVEALAPAIFRVGGGLRRS